VKMFEYCKANDEACRVAPPSPPAQKSLRPAS
jgi:hypothetical protein